MRPRLRSLIAHGGERVATLDALAGAHRVLVRGIAPALAHRFDPAMAAELGATFELRVRDPRGGSSQPFAIRIADGRCIVTPGPAVDAGAVATIGAADMIRLASGTVGWPELLSSGRLELTGDPFLALRFPMLFRLPVERTNPR